MELLDGDTLRDELRRRGRLEAARTVDVLRGVCSAVEAAHRHRLVHRDLKPENIFLVNAGGGHEAAVKVLDFGVAKPLSRNGGHGDGALETDVGVLVGTVGYMSPEQLLGERPDVSCDLWALAVVAYESLAGALPFPVTSRELWRHLVLAGRPTPLATTSRARRRRGRTSSTGACRPTAPGARFRSRLPCGSRGGARRGGTAQASASTGARGETRRGARRGTSSGRCRRGPGGAGARRAVPRATSTQVDARARAAEARSGPCTR